MDSQTQYCLMRRDLEERVWRLTSRVLDTVFPAKVRRKASYCDSPRRDECRIASHEARRRPLSLPRTLRQEGWHSFENQAAMQPAG
jgi:hypothetical protein